VPANAVAVVMKAQEGAELMCRAHNYRFNENGTLINRGVISYYAARTLPKSTTVKDWLGLIDSLSTSDVKEGRLKQMYQPSLKIIGNPATNLPGIPLIEKRNDLQKKPAR
jgi:hypothetical protein